VNSLTPSGTALLDAAERIHLNIYVFANSAPARLLALFQNGY
jgi:hypothetical protein